MCYKVPSISLHVLDNCKTDPNEPVFVRSRLEGPIARVIVAQFWLSVIVNVYYCLSDPFFVLLFFWGEGVG